MGRALGRCAIVSAIGLACAKGDGPTSSGLSGASLGEGGETQGTDTEGTDDTAGGSGSGSGGSSGSAPGSSSSGAGSSSSGGATCSDMMMNGDETDIDCGGSCMPCVTGQACVGPTDCDTAICDGNLCCTSSMYERTTGEISGSGMVCCDGDDARLEITACGSGMNYTVQEEGANCASTSEGAMNNGTACVTVTCESLVCTADAGSGTM